MTPDITAAVVQRPADPFELKRLTLEEPGPGEVLVQIRGVGMCHTDLIARDQEYPVPFPIVLGHEGSGIVEAVGPGVDHVAAGDHVVLTYARCGHCPNCIAGRHAHCVDSWTLNFGGARADGSSPLRSEGSTVHGAFFGQSSFATHALAAGYGVVKVRDDVPIELLGPLGCGVMTGAGAILNVLDPRHGDTVAIFGAGAVGLSAVLAAALTPAAATIVVDVQPERLRLARELGATDVVDASREDPVQRIQELTGGDGADLTLEATGIPAVLRQAVDALARPGTCGLVGAPPVGAEVSLDVTTLLTGRTLTGVIQGEGVPAQFIPHLVDLYAAGRFPFDRLVRTYPLAAVNEAAADAVSGVTVKPVLIPK
jgi:aryl-alcohol dehydrogenase